MTTMKSPVAIVLGIFGLLFWLGYAYYNLLDFPLFLVEGKSSIGLQLLMIAYGYTTLLVGVFLGSVYRMVKKIGDEDSIDIRSVVKAALRSTDFWLGMFASPVVYVILLQAINLDKVSLVAFIGITLVGLQNGFVCNVVADTLIGEKPKLTRRPRAKSRS